MKGRKYGIFWILWLVLLLLPGILSQEVNIEDQVQNDYTTELNILEEQNPLSEPVTAYNPELKDVEESTIDQSLIDEITLPANINPNKSIVVETESKKESDSNDDTIQKTLDTSSAKNEIPIPEVSKLEEQEKAEEKFLNDNVLLQRFGLADTTRNTNNLTPFELSGKIIPSPITPRPDQFDQFPSIEPNLDPWKPVWPFEPKFSIKPTVRFPSITLPLASRLEPTKIYPPISKQFSIPKEPITAYYFDLSSTPPIHAQGPLYETSILSLLSPFSGSSSSPPVKEIGEDLSELESSIDDNVQSPNQRFPVAIEATPAFRQPNSGSTIPTRIITQHIPVVETNIESLSIVKPTSVLNSDHIDSNKLSSIYDWTSPRIKTGINEYSLGNATDFQFSSQEITTRKSNLDINTDLSLLHPSTIIPESESTDTNIPTGDLTHFDSTTSVNALLSINNTIQSSLKTEQNVNINSSTLPSSRIPLWQRLSEKASTQTTVSSTNTNAPLSTTSSSIPFENDIPIGILSSGILKTPSNSNINPKIIKNKTNTKPLKLKPDTPDITLPKDLNLEPSFVSTTASTVYDIDTNTELITNILSDILSSINISSSQSHSINTESALKSISSTDISQYPSINEKDMLSDFKPIKSTLVTDVPYINTSEVPQISISKTLVVSTTHSVAPSISVVNSDVNNSTDYLEITENDALDVFHPNKMLGLTLRPTAIVPVGDHFYSDSHYYDYEDKEKDFLIPFEYYPFLNTNGTTATPSTIESSSLYDVYDKDVYSNIDLNYNRGFGSLPPPPFRQPEEPVLSGDTDVNYTFDNGSDLADQDVEVIQLPEVAVQPEVEENQPLIPETPSSSTTTAKPTSIRTTTKTSSTTSSTSTTKSEPSTRKSTRRPALSTTTTERKTTTTPKESILARTNKPAYEVPKTEAAMIPSIPKNVPEEKLVVDKTSGAEPNLTLVKVENNGTKTSDPSPFVKAAISYDNREFCEHKGNIHALLREWINIHITNNTKSGPYEIEVFHQPNCDETSISDQEEIAAEENKTHVYFYVKENGRINRNVTVLYPKNPITLDISKKLDYLKQRILHLELVNAPHDEAVLIEEAMGTSIVIISIVSSILVVLLVASLLAFVLLRKRKSAENVHGKRCTPANDAYSLDSVSMFYHSIRRKSRKRASNKSLKSYLNQGFDDPNGPSYPLNFQKLTLHVSDKEGIYDEFTKIPSVTPKYDELPRGVEDKNRYANVIPISETRILLNNNTPLTEYINANTIHGPRNELRYYIATQAPLDETVRDFWQMIWEQESKIIVMLTDFVEKGMDKCADYLPPSETLDCHRVYGEFQITLKSRDLREKYVVSIVQIKNLENNLVREIAHMWFTGWPHSGVPMEEKHFISFIFDVRTTRKQLRTKGPIVVHCSPGTGRTGTYIASDLVMRQFDDQKVVDVPKTVFRIRRERAGAVQTKEQYAFIYRVVNLYAAKLTTGNLDSF